MQTSENKTASTSSLLRPRRGEKEADQEPPRRGAAEHSNPPMALSREFVKCSDVGGRKFLLDKVERQ